MWPMELVAKLLCLKIKLVKWGLTRFQVGNRGCCHASPLESKLWRAPWRQRPPEENHPAFQVMLSGTSAQVPVNGEDKENFWRQNVLTVQVLVLWTTSHTNMDHFFGDKHSAIVPEKLDSNYIFGQISFHQNSCCKSILQIYPEEYSRLSALGPEPAPPWVSLGVLGCNFFGCQVSFYHDKPAWALLPTKSIHKCIEPNISGAWCRKCHFVWTCLRPPKFFVHMQDSLGRLLAIVLFYVSWVDVNRWLACQLIAWGIAVILLLELQNRMGCGEKLQWGHHLQLQLEL